MIINNQELNIEIEYKKIKNIYFRIKDENTILVTCSKLVPKVEINRLLEKNKNKLTKMYAKYINDHKSNNKVLYLGHEFNFIPNKKIMFMDMNAYGPSIEAINTYLEKRSLKHFEERLKIYQCEFNNLPNFRLRIRKMSSRWGVNNRSSMTITLNSLLIHKSNFLIDYVIVHELSHFEHMDHSSAFWACVERHYPDYKKARKELKD